MNRIDFLTRRTALPAALALIVLAAATAWRILLLARLPDQGFFAKYLVFADRILAGDVPVARLADLSPGYLWMIVMLRGVGLEYAGIRAVQVLFVTIGIAALSWMLWRRAGATAAVAAAIVLFFNRAALLNASELEPESAIFLWISLLIAFAAWPGPKRWGMAGAAGLAAGLAVATRPSHLLVAVVAAIWISFEFAPHRRRALLAYALGLAMPLVAALSVNAALTGQWILMNPGTVFYEGMNSAASGYSAVAPRVVTDLEGCIREPDALHVSYRIVAGRSTGAAIAEPRAANRFWTERSLRWASAFPAAALALTGRKLAASVHSFEAWDLSTLERKSRQMGRIGWIPFGFVFLLAVVGVFLRPQRFTGFLAALALGGILVMSLFYVSARQRNAVLPPAGALAGIGVAAIAHRLREGRRKEGLALGATTLLVGALLTLPSNAARENLHLWSAQFHSSDLLHRAAEAGREGRADEMRALRSLAATWDPDLAHPVDANDLVTLAARMMERGVPPERQFDLARALLGAGRPVEADAILITLGPLEYAPVRETRGESSVALLRARAALALGDVGEAGRFAREALEQAPGDPLALAMAADTGVDSGAAALLAHFHDPFTGQLARARVAADRGDREGARDSIQNTARAFPYTDCVQRRWQRRIAP